MTDEQIWAIYFAGLGAMRFHPKNDTDGLMPAQRIRFAASMADAMLQQHRERFPWPGSPPAQQ